MKALKIVGIVLGALLLLTGAGLLAGSALVDKGQGAFEQELGKSGYAGPVEGVVRSVAWPSLDFSAGSLPGGGRDLLGHGLPVRSAVVGHQGEVRAFQQPRQTEVRQYCASVVG